MRKPILLLLIMLFLTSCSNASTPDSQAFPDAAELPTLPPSTGTSTAILETSVTLPVHGTAPTQVPPTFFYTPPPTQLQSTSQPATSTPMGTPRADAYEVFTLHMVDEDHGWAIFRLGRLYEADFWLGRSTDGALTWQNVTPPAFDTLQTGAVSYSQDTNVLKVYVLDAETAWAYTSCFTTSGDCYIPTAIWRTEDGGRTWQTLNIPTACRAEQIDCVPNSLLFVDLQHGWLMMALVERNYVQFDYYRTTDGGQTWEELPRLEDSRNALIINRPTFFDEQFGLRLPSGPIADPIDKIKIGQLLSLDVTRDGGYTLGKTTSLGTRGTPGSGTFIR